MDLMHSERLPLAQQVALLAGLTAAAFSFRFLPYAFEEYQAWQMLLWASPVLAMFLLGVSKCRSYWLGLLLPMAGFIVSDIVIQVILTAQGKPTSSLAGRLVTYGLFLGLSQLGLLLRYLRRPVLVQLAAAFSVSVAGTTLFFLVSNFLVWINSTPASVIPYPKTWTGLMDCYVKALPFYTNQLLMEPVFIVALFGGYALLEARILAGHASRPELETV
jgi:hypothetical protein